MNEDRPAYDQTGDILSALPNSGTITRSRDGLNHTWTLDADAIDLTVGEDALRLHFLAGLAAIGCTDPEDAAFTLDFKNRQFVVTARRRAVDDHAG